MKINKTKIEHLQNWMFSDKTQTEYSRENGLKYSTCQNWKHKRKSANIDWQPIVIKEEEKQ